MTDAPPWVPLIVNCRGSVADAMQARRVQLGLTMEAVDHRAGLQSGYAGKLLRPNTPQGRAGTHFRAVADRMPSGDIFLSGSAEWLMEALQLRLVVVDEETAARLEAVPAPRRVSGPASAHHAKHRDGRTRLMTCGQHEAMHGAKVARDLLRTSVVDHPFVSEDPSLRAEAEAIDALMLDLYAKIAAAD
jgi:hypothetical protein